MFGIALKEMLKYLVEIKNISWGNRNKNIKKKRYYNCYSLKKNVENWTRKQNILIWKMIKIMLYLYNFYIEKFGRIC